MTLVVKAKQRRGAFALDAAQKSECGITAFRSFRFRQDVDDRIIAGLARPDDGQVILDGEVVTDTDRRIFVAKHRRRFGYAF